MDTSKQEKKARQAVERRNYDYAVEIYLQVLTVSPDNLDARKALRAVAVRRAKENGTGGLGRFVSKLKSYAIGSKGDPDKRMLKSEQILKNDPGNVGALVALGKAAFEAKYAKTAVWVFEDLRNNHPKDVSILRMLQEVYQRTDEMDKALQINQGILKLKPGDRDASEAVKNISAGTVTRKIEGAKTAHDMVRKKDEVEKLHRRDSGLRTEEDVREEIKYTLQDIQEREKDPNLRVKLGQLHMRLKEWDPAKAAFEQAREISPTEFRMQMLLDDVEINRMRHTYEELAKKGKAGDAAAQQEYKKLYSKYMNFRLASFEKREQNYPTELGIAYDLGQLYYAFKRFDDAILRFQKTINDPKRRPMSALRLGQSFSAKGQHDLAIRRLAEGIEGLEIMSEMKKELLYCRGTVYEQHGKEAEAKKDFMTIYEVDIAFQDVAKKVED